LHYVKKLRSLRGTAAFGNGQESLQLFEIHGLGGMGLQSFILVHVCGIRIGPTNLSHRIASCGEVSHLVSAIDLRENPHLVSRKSPAKQVQQQHALSGKVITGVTGMRGLKLAISASESRVCLLTI